MFSSAWKTIPFWENRTGVQIFKEMRAFFVLSRNLVRRWIFLKAFIIIKNVLSVYAPIVCKIFWLLTLEKIIFKFFLCSMIKVTYSKSYFYSENKDVSDHEKSYRKKPPVINMFWVSFPASSYRHCPVRKNLWFTMIDWSIKNKKLFPSLEICISFFVLNCSNMHGVQLQSTLYIMSW
jgi:hypothetical protein